MIHRINSISGLCRVGVFTILTLRGLCLAFFPSTAVHELTGLTSPTRQEASVIKAEKKKEREKDLAFYTAGGMIHTWLLLQLWRHINEKRLLHGFGFWENKNYCNIDNDNLIAFHPLSPEK